MTSSLPHSATFARHLCASTNLAVFFEASHPEHRLRASSRLPPFKRSCQLAVFDSCAEHRTTSSTMRHGRRVRPTIRFPSSLRTIRPFVRGSLTLDRDKTSKHRAGAHTDDLLLTFLRNLQSCLNSPPPSSTSRESVPSWRRFSLPKALSRWAICFIICLFGTKTG